MPLYKITTKQRKIPKAGLGWFMHRFLHHSQRHHAQRRSPLSSHRGSTIIVLFKSPHSIRLYILGSKIPAKEQRPLNSLVIRQKQQVTTLFEVQGGGRHFLTLTSGLRFDSQAQRELVSLDLSVLVDVAVAQQDGSQLVQLGTGHVGLQGAKK